MKAVKIIVLLAAVGGAAFAVTKALKSEKGQETVQKVKVKVDMAKSKIASKKASDGVVAEVCCDEAAEEIIADEAACDGCCETSAESATDAPASDAE